VPSNDQGAVAAQGRPRRSAGQDAPPLSSSDIVYRGVIRGLYEQRYLPGQRLVEADLNRQFNVSRSSIREALARLTSAGVITHVPHRGACIRVLSRADVADVLQVVELMIGLAARGAARHIAEPGHSERLRGRYDALAAFDWVENFERFLDEREEFYRALLQLSGNKELIRVFPAMQVHIMRLQLRGWNRAGDAMRKLDYANLTRAILSGDEGRAEEAGRLHVRHTIDDVGGLPEDAFNPSGA
jgi:DNA-binding GntR family transcriptional regulator